MKAINILIILLHFFFNVNAQDQLTNKGNFQIYSGASLTFFGNFSNTASFINNGSLSLKGNITNDQLPMIAGSGTLNLVGAGAETINGSQTFKTFNLVTNNTAGITLNNNLSVAGAHTFTSGMIITSAAPNYLIYQSGSSYSGDADSRHVNGWVKKFGSTDFVFPVGNATIERNISLINLSGASEFNARYASSTPNSAQVQLPMQVINTAEYWTVNKISGGSASLTMNWDNSKVPFPNWVLSDIRVAYYNGSNWIEAGGTAAGNVGITGTITSNSVAAFNNFTLGSRNFPLPVHIISFTAQRFNSSTQISWIAASEENVNHFDVQCSDDGINFYSITIVPARHRGIPEYYTAIDNAVIHNIAYYRLNCIDNDGRNKYSKVVSIKENDLIKDLKLVINPVHEQIVLSASELLNGSFHYEIKTANAELVKQRTLLIQHGGIYTITLPSNITAGVYVLEVNNPITKFNYRVVVK